MAETRLGAIKELIKLSKVKPAEKPKVAEKPKEVPKPIAPTPSGPKR